MTEFEKKIIEQNEKMIKNQETIIEILHFSPFMVFNANTTNYVAFAEPYYKHHNMPLEPLYQHLKEQEELHEKHECEPIGQSDSEQLGEEV